MAGVRPSVNEKLQQRIIFLEGQLRGANRLAAETLELQRENAELRKRQHWLEQENNRLITQRSAVEQIGRRAETA